MVKGRHPVLIGGKCGNHSTRNNFQRTQKARDSKALDRRGKKIKKKEAASDLRPQAPDQREAALEKRRQKSAAMKVT